MSDIKFFSLGFISTFLAGMLLAPVVMSVARRLKAGQTTLKYVTQHDEKSGTLTFGGLIFILAVVIVTAVFGGFRYSLARTALVVTLAYGVIGFLDDFIKVRLKDNKGLRAYQKIIFQLGVAIVTAVFAYKSEYIGSKIALNFSLGEWDMKGFYIPFAVVVFLALSNGVNLTDGLDGLAGTTTALYSTFFTIVILIEYIDAVKYGKTLYAEELKHLAFLSVCVIGGVVAFLWFNSHKAKIFMGDTGSLALGGFTATQALFIKNPLLSALVGIVMVISCLSVILQVISFKTRGKRIFLMAPYHHHLELKGVNESKIVGYYAIITLIAGVTALIII